ncbi:MAG: flippase, partial [Hominenteromicrobium sp.]
KEMVNNRDDEGKIVGTGIVMRLCASVVSMACILVLLLCLNPGNQLVLRVAFLQSLVLVFHAFDLIDFWFQSYLRSKYVAIVKSISYVIVAAYKIYILASGKSVEWFAFSTSFDFLLIAVMLLIVYRFNGGKPFRFSLETAKSLIRQSYHFILSGLIITVYTQMDKIMIQQMLGETEVGLYSAALTICNYWVLIPTAMINSMRPSIMEQKKLGNEALYLKKIRRLYAVLIWSGIFVSTVISLLSPWIISILYKEVYAPAATTLSIAIWYTTFSTLGIARGIWLVCENKNKYVKKCVFWGMLINLLLNYFLIPVWGINGAAVATLVTQIFNSIIAPMLYKEIRVHTKYILQAFLLKGVL